MTGDLLQLGIGPLSVRAELERTMKMESENESENGHFCKIERYARFFKNEHFSSHFEVHF